MNISDAVKKLEAEIVQASEQKKELNYVQAAERVLRLSHLSADDMFYLAARGLAAQVNPASLSFSVNTPEAYDYGAGEGTSSSRPPFRFPTGDTRSAVRPIQKTPLSILNRIYQIRGVPFVINDCGISELSDLAKHAKAHKVGWEKVVNAAEYTRGRLLATGKRFVKDLTEAERLRVAKKFEGNEVLD